MVKKLVKKVVVVMVVEVINVWKKKGRTPPPSCSPKSVFRREATGAFWRALSNPKRPLCPARKHAHARTPREGGEGGNGRGSVWSGGVWEAGASGGVDYLASLMTPKTLQNISLNSRAQSPRVITQKTLEYPPTIITDAPWSQTRSLPRIY